MTNYQKLPPLSQGLGYGIVVGVGLAFAVCMIFVTGALRRYQREKVDAVEFATAGRSVNTGLVASAVVSSWTWSATLLVSTTQAYTNGVFGPYTYAAGATVQIVLFATLAIELKRKAPGVYTYLEMVRARFGTAAHIIYMCFAVSANILVMAMLIAGCSATIESLTGMNEIAACFLIPLGVTIYTLFGGLKATFLTDYIHTLIMFVIMFVLVFTVWANNDTLGSPNKVYDLLVEAGQKYPVDGNKDGSYLTFRSHNAGIFFVITISGAFGSVFLDTGFWNKAIAASPAAALPGYLLGGMSWFAIPWGFATTMGLAGRVLEHTDLWPTYPRGMTPDEVSAGLTLPYTAVALLGSGGGAAILLMVFMAVTSAASGEMVAVSSIWTYDVYRTYINRDASSKQLIRQTHYSVVVFVLVMIGFSIGLKYGDIGMGYLYTMMGVLVCSAVIPVSLTFFWSGLNRWSAYIAPPLGMGLGIAVWMGTTAALYDNQFTIATTGADYPMMAGNLVSLLSPLPIIAVCQLIGGHAHFDFNEVRDFQNLREVTNDDDISSNIFHEQVVTNEQPSMNESGLTAQKSKVHANQLMAREQHEKQINDEEELLARSAKLARIICAVIILALIIVWPMPMLGSNYIFSKPFFTGWAVVGIIWLFFAMIVVELLPLWQGREAIAHTIRGIYWDITGQSYKLRQWQDEHPEDLHVAFSPIKAPIYGIEVPSSDTPALVKSKEVEEQLNA